MKKNGHFFICENDPITNWQLKKKLLTSSANKCQASNTIKGSWWKECPDNVNEDMKHSVNEKKKN